MIFRKNSKTKNNIVKMIFNTPIFHVSLFLNILLKKFNTICRIYNYIEFQKHIKTLNTIYVGVT